MKITIYCDTYANSDDYGRAETRTVFDGTFEELRDDDFKFEASTYYSSTDEDTYYWKTSIYECDDIRCKDCGKDYTIGELEM